MNYASRILHLSTIFLFAAASLFAQTTGTLRGRVLDPSGAFVPKATITITGPDTRARVTTSNNEGVFSILALTQGDYAVRATAVGFGVAETKLTIAAGRTSTLDIHLIVALNRQQVAVVGEGQVEVDPANNASAIVLKGDDLNILSDDPGDLQTDLQALAGPAAGPSGGQIFIDGFSNGQLPPKESIREVRINSNPFSAEFDRSGMGRIEILTKPGTDKFHGSANLNFADSALNSRNPFAPSKPPTQMRQFYGNFSGPLSGKSSFTVAGGHGTYDSSALINAQILDALLRPVSFTQNVLTPNTYDNASPRLDYALTPNVTLQGRYTWYRYASENSGVGDFSLLSRATNSEYTYHSIQFTETQVIGTRLINESRFQFSRNRNDTRGDGSSPSINVLSSFNGGGANVSHDYDRNESYEFQNNSSYVRGKHVVRFGARIRGSRQDSYSTSNYNGSFTFTSIDTYITTLQGIAQGLPMSQIKAQGGGARQYSVSGGIPLTSVNMVDAAPFVQDDWRLKPNLTLSLGLRYEIQTNIRNQGAWAPRIGVAWGIGKGQGNGRAPKTVLRLGWGMFYARVGQGLTLQTLRQNGITQQNFLITSPDFYPDAPPVSQLVASLRPQAIRTIDSTIQAPQMYQSAVTLEKQLPKNITVSGTYTNTRGVHQLRSRNINAPLPGTFTGSGTGFYPFGTSGQLFLYESSALFMQHQLIVNFNARVSPKFTLFGFYSFNRYRSDSDGSGGFPANNYDLSGEWGRATGDRRHTSTIGGNITLPFKLQISPNLNLWSEGPVNIITGTDLNGDTNFNDRPALAAVPADPSRGVIASRWGVFNTDPIRHPEYGSVLIPRNYGAGYGFFGIFLTLTRTWTFGESAAAAPAASANRPATTSTNAPKPPGRYRLQLSISARNALNHVNPAPPNSNLSSPFFGRTLQSTYGANANRRIQLGLQFGF